MGDDSVGQHDGDQIGPLLDERTAELFLVRTVCVSRASSNAAGLGHIKVDGCLASAVRYETSSRSGGS
jgi:hypothetical protein